VDVASPFLSTYVATAPFAADDLLRDIKVPASHRRTMRSRQENLVGTKRN
jgi:hypothetical protein